MVNSRIQQTSTLRDNVRARTPMRCPVCGGELSNVRIRDMGGLTANIVWQIHAGECPEHGWFQAEFSARPPREIFPVDRPFGSTRRMLIGDREYFEFTTLWGSSEREARLARVDPLDRSRGEKVDPLDPAQWATSAVDS